MITDFILGRINVHDFASILVATPGFAKGVAKVKYIYRGLVSVQQRDKDINNTKAWIHTITRTNTSFAASPSFRGGKLL